MKMLRFFLMVALTILLFPLAASAGPNDWLVPWSESISLCGTTYAGHLTFEGKTQEKFALDFSLEDGCELFAPCSGVMYRYASEGSAITTGGMTDYGNYVMFMPDDYDSYIIMAHFEYLAPEIVTRFENGDYQINRGELLGYMGSTGYSTGTHLHFEITVPKHEIQSVWGYPVETIMGSGVAGGIGSQVTSLPAVNAEGEIRIISAFAKNPEVILGETIMVYVKTSENVELVELLDEDGEHISESIYPTTHHLGEKEWDIEATLDSPAKRLLVCAWTGEKGFQEWMQVKVIDPLSQDTNSAKIRIEPYDYFADRNDIDKGYYTVPRVQIRENKEHQNFLQEIINGKIYELTGIKVNLDEDNRTTWNETSYYRCPYILVSDIICLDNEEYAYVFLNEFGGFYLNLLTGEISTVQDYFVDWQRALSDIRRYLDRLQKVDRSSSYISDYSLIPSIPMAFMNDYIYLCSYPIDGSENVCIPLSIFSTNLKPAYKQLNTSSEWGTISMDNLPLELLNLPEIFSIAMETQRLKRGETITIHIYTNDSVSYIRLYENINGYQERNHHYNPSDSNPFSTYVEHEDRTREWAIPYYVPPFMGPLGITDLIVYACSGEYTESRGVDFVISDYYEFQVFVEYDREKGVYINPEPVLVNLDKDADVQGLVVRIDNRTDMDIRGLEIEYKIVDAFGDPIISETIKHTKFSSDGYFVRGIPVNNDLSVIQSGRGAYIKIPIYGLYTRNNFQIEEVSVLRVIDSAPDIKEEAVFQTK